MGKAALIKLAANVQLGVSYVVSMLGSRKVFGRMCQVAGGELTPIQGVAMPGKCMSINIDGCMHLIDTALNKDTLHPS